MFAISHNKKLKQTPQNVTFHYQRIIFPLLSIYCFCFLYLYLFICLYIYISFPTYFVILKKSVSIFSHQLWFFIRLIFNNFGGEQRCCFKMSTRSRTTQKLHPTLKPPNVESQCYPCYPENLGVWN